MKKSKKSFVKIILHNSLISNAVAKRQQVGVIMLNSVEKDVSFSDRYECDNTLNESIASPLEDLNKCIRCEFTSICESDLKKTFRETW